MRLWKFQNQWINTDRIVRVEQKQDLFTVHWTDERNAVQSFTLRPDQWEKVKDEIQA